MIDMTDQTSVSEAPAASASAPKAKKGWSAETRARYRRTLAQKRTATQRTVQPRVASAAPEVTASTGTQRGFEDEPVTRVGRDQRMTNNFPVPAYGKKPGRDYQWIATHVLGEPVTTPPVTEFYEGGWRPEKAADWPTLVSPGTAPDAPVDRLGQRLFGRPMQFTIEARQEDYNAAEQQRRDRMLGAIEGRPSGGDGLSGVRGVRVQPLLVEVEGEIGSAPPRARTA